VTAPAPDALAPSTSSAPPVASGAPPRAWAGLGTRRASAWRLVLLLGFGVFFLLPLVAMLEFSTRGAAGRSFAAWRAIVRDPDLVGAITVSLELAALTVAGMLVLLVPVATWVHLRLPKVRRLIEFICLLPLTIPAIVLVVGIAPIYAWVNYFFGESSLTLAFVYVILVLPYAYRAIDNGLGAIDLRTLAEAARSLGAGWGTVLVRVVVPNIRGALVSASFLSVALVLGEFTLASLLNFNNLQVTINLLGKRAADVSVAVSLASLVFAFVLLIGLSFVGRRRSSSGVTEEG
jgi:putative spermidine/putrescine transport system permease protein